MSTPTLTKQALAIANTLAQTLMTQLPTANGNAIRAQLNALNKACSELAAGLNIQDVGPDAYLVPSRTTAGTIYRVDLEHDICSCPHGEQGQLCWHKSAADAFERALVAEVAFAPPADPDWDIYPTDLPETAVEMVRMGKLPTCPELEPAWWDHIGEILDREEFPWTEVTL